MADKKIIVVMGATGSQGGGLVRAILNDKAGEFTVRAITRDVNSETAKELAALGAEVVAADLDDAESLQKAFKDAYGAFCVTFFWNHFSPEKEINHAKLMAEAAKQADVKHVIWSTLEDTRKWIPLSDDRMPTLMGNYKVPHVDSKGEGDRFFIDAGVPTTFLLTSFFWDNMIHFGMGPKRGEDGTLAITLPMGDSKLAGIAAEDIGKCAYGIFKGGPDKYAGKFIGIAGDFLTGIEIADLLSKTYGETVRYNKLAPEIYRSFGFPGAEDLGNMFQYFAEFDQVFTGARDLDVSRQLNASLQTLGEWLAQNKDRILVE
ncbi:NmrA/HSCARG family protein [Paenibacillus psychroresistens]|uniref:NmrA/HSCARG family protein n=1 Tax=Paenibacillus psychroresistens TaxID=1778678 RepID=A0A6B8RU40_9BACL|nr:NmrA/HSCARG family protein [Paenibacillus psychroresistens]QGQ99312.1 NmrA/HSCARG family protein [Paenibacillus psychroresistens]